MTSPLDGSTALDPDEAEGLKIASVATMSELDEHEQHNIESAKFQLATMRLGPRRLLGEAFARRLHKMMFGEVWRWAGTFRTTEKNIGVEKWRIPTELKKLCDDAVFWFENEVYTPDELALRFKHRLVSIHCFANGNGRHSRLMADLIVTHLFKMPPFSWGRHAGDPRIHTKGSVRDRYLEALHAADAGNFEPLIAFARS